MFRLGGVLRNRLCVGLGEFAFMLQKKKPAQTIDCPGHFVLFTRLTAAVLFLCPLYAAGIALNGRVVDENDAPVAGARITVRSGSGSWEAQSEPTGAFIVILPAPGDYRLTVEREGYYESKDIPVTADASREITLVVNTVREVFQSVVVNEKPFPVDLSGIANHKSSQALK